MKRTPTIAQLCARHHNEDAHTEHVASIGRILFDAVCGSGGLTRNDRRLLLASCRLHDIAYSTDAANHAQAGAARLLRTGVAGFSKEECRAIAAVILLHQKRYEKRIHDPLIRALPHESPQRRRILRLAAILRVADGLDHEHIQNVSIASARRVGGEFRVVLRGGLSNILAAEAKADLWRTVFPHGIVLRGLSPCANPPRSRGTVLETARRLLCVHYRTVADNLEGAIAARSPMPLHDIRVAIRRLCAVLRAFRKPLERTAAARLAPPFARLNSELGPIRDSDVWLAYLHAEKLQRRMKDDRTWPAYVSFHESARRRDLRALRRLLRDRRVRGLMRRAARVCRVDLPELIHTRHSTPIRPFAAGQLKRVFDRVVQYHEMTPATPPNELHRLRKLCRRGRYYAEFFAPALGPASTGLARRFKRLADPLGRIHDMDVALERIGNEPVPPPRQLRKFLSRRRAAAWKDFRKAWRAIRRRKVIQRVTREV